MRIRKCKDKDTRKVSNLIRKCLLEVNSLCQPKSIISGLCEEFSPPNLRARLRRFDVYVAVDGSTVFGTASLSADHIMSVFVAPRFHGQGIGALLMSAVENIAEKRGFSKVYLSASPNAVGFYRKLGYRKGRDFYNHVGGYMTRMSKKLLGKTVCGSPQPGRM